MKSVSITFLVLVFFLVTCNASPNIGKKLSRIKRQNPGDAFIDAIFQVPIQTLSSVGTLIKTSRPVIMNVRQRIIQSLTPPQQNGQRPTRYTPQQIASNQYTPQQLAGNQYTPQQLANNRVGLPNSFYNKLYNQPHRFSFSSSKQTHRGSSSNRVYRDD